MITDRRASAAPRSGAHFAPGKCATVPQAERLRVCLLEPPVGRSRASGEKRLPSLLLVRGLDFGQHLIQLPARQQPAVGDDRGDLRGVVDVGQRVGVQQDQIDTSLQLAEAMMSNEGVLALLAANNGQNYLIDVFDPLLPLIEPALLAALHL